MQSSQKDGPFFEQAPLGQYIEEPELAPDMSEEDKEEYALSEIKFFET